MAIFDHQLPTGQQPDRFWSDFGAVFKSVVGCPSSVLHATRARGRDGAEKCKKVPNGARKCRQVAVGLSVARRQRRLRGSVSIRAHPWLNCFSQGLAGLTRWHLSAALSSFRRAIRAHTRLARLAPQFFDAVTIERERREREDRRRWMALWEPALARAYGGVPPPHKPEDDLPPLPPPQTQRAVDRQLACWNLWFNLGREALRRHQQRRPHELIDFSRLARLLELASDLRRLACGVDSGFADPQPANHDAARADLKRAYGHLSSPVNYGPNHYGQRTIFSMFSVFSGSSFTGCPRRGLPFAARTGSCWR